MKVLVLHPAAAYGGASKSLCEFATHAIAAGTEMHVLCPPGKAADAFRLLGIVVHPVRGLSQLDNTRYGRYRGVRWLVVLRELALLPGAFIALLKIRAQQPFDLIHANEVTLLPMGLLAKWLLGRPLLVHVRSLQYERGPVTHWIANKLKKSVDAVVAIDESVKRTLPSDLDVYVVHNGLNVDHAALPREERVFRVGIVGLLLKLKGVYDFVEAARILLEERGVRGEFWIVGENARPMTGLKGWLLRKLDFSRDVRSELEDIIVSNGLESSVLLKGFQNDVQAVYRELDVLCFPSYLDAAGRPVFEAAFFEVPSIVAVRDPPSDSIIHNETGLCISSPDPMALADAIDYLYRNPAERERLGRNALALAKRNFDIRQNSRHLLSLYQKLSERETR